MGFFKKVFSNAVDELKKNLEDSKNEMFKNLHETESDNFDEPGFQSSKTTSESPISRDNDSEIDGCLGKLANGILTVSEGIEELDDESLEGYNQLRKIVLPASLKKLDSEVVNKQKLLEEIDFSKVTQLTEIPEDFISGQTLIKKFVIPQGVTKVGDNFLGDCNSGVKVFVPSSVKEIGTISGNGDNDLDVYLFAQDLDISDIEEDINTLYVLEESYNDYKKQLKDADSDVRVCKIPEEMLDVYGISMSLDDNTDEIQSSITDDNSDNQMPVKTISGKSVRKEDFPNFNTLKSIVIPDGITTISKEAFMNCENLESVTLPKSVTVIGENAFKFCSNLASINIPDSVTTIGQGAFHTCRRLKSITLPEGITTIEKRTFQFCKDLNDITIPESVKTIKMDAFMGCQSLESIKIPENVTTIEGSAFSHCKSLSSITIPSKVKTIKQATFGECQSLSSVVLEGVETIEYYAFVGCKSLASVSVPKNIKKIERGAFEGCKNLKDKPKTGWF